MLDSSTEQQRKKAKELLDEIFQHYTNLSLEWVDDGAGIVRIAFDDGYPSQTRRIGTRCRRVPQNEWTTNLQCISRDTVSLCPEEKQTIIHEGMHILAFVHEHQVPERRKHVLFDRPKVYEHYREEYGWHKEVTKHNITKRYPPEKLENYSPFDHKSITLYELPSHIMKGGPGTDYNTDLSDTDKAVLVLNYARLDRDPLVSTWTVSYAADVIGIKGEWREKIVAATHPHDIRQLYSQWSASPQRFE